jgi:uncharacterized protein YndB with AHSA1/START domain
MRRVEAALDSPRADRVVAAFTDVRALQAWWGVERALVQPQVGGVWAVTWAGQKYVATGRITELQPGRRLVISDYLYLNADRPAPLGPMTLAVEAKGTRFWVCQDGYADGPEWDWYYEAVRAAWPRALPPLKTWLEKAT